MKKRFLAHAMAMAFLLGLLVQPVQILQAAQIREEETSQILEEAVENLEEGTYVEGEALVSMEATQAAALAKEGTYRLDKKVRMESVSSFGTDEQTGKEQYIVCLKSDQYTTEELMKLALKQNYVDGVCANQLRKLCSAVKTI